MTEFNREDRYVVLKRKDLEHLPIALQETLWSFLEKAEFSLPPRQYVVVESDWPEYETVFKMIEARMTGVPNQIERLIAEAVAADDWSGKAARLIAELTAQRDLLKLKLSLADESAHGWQDLYDKAMIQLRKSSEERDVAMADVDRIEWLGRFMTWVHSGDGGYLHQLNFSHFTSLKRLGLRAAIDDVRK